MKKALHTLTVLSALILSGGALLAGMSGDEQAQIERARNITAQMKPLQQELNSISESIQKNGSAQAKSAFKVAMGSMSVLPVTTAPEVAITASGRTGRLLSNP